MVSRYHMTRNRRSSPTDWAVSNSFQWFIHTEFSVVVHCSAKSVLHDGNQTDSGRASILLYRILFREGFSTAVIKRVLTIIFFIGSDIIIFSWYLQSLNTAISRRLVSGTLAATRGQLQGTAGRFRISFVLGVSCKKW